MNNKNKTIFIFLSIIGVILFLLGCNTGFDIFGNSEIELTQVTFSYKDSNPDWSPDGLKIIFVHQKANQQEIWQSRINTGKAAKLFFDGMNPAWHPLDEKLFAYQENGTIHKVEVKIRIELTNNGYFDSQPSWSPNGTKIAFTRSMAVETIWIMNADGSNQKQLTTTSDEHCSSPSFSRDGTKIVFIKSPEKESAINEIWIMNSDGTGKQKIFAPGNTQQNISKCAWNKDNKILFSRTYLKGKNDNVSSDIWIMNSDGSKATSLLESSAYNYNNPVWNKEGNKIAINMGTISNGNSEAGTNIYFFSYD